ncbi:Alpha/beta hydrolase family protein [Syntrophus gentianae]|uniref:Alpha/beta hydrolase family protein n=1 Tax=Syntrophus gentianae TaxID=43775 RepID=A0A1H7UCN6_9BACT|nr:hypothetical protein [Syntrophus gentianae]SEL94027.1 Alpha/beta hydrolase family protein [Syntrophus gentianae]
MPKRKEELEKVRPSLAVIDENGKAVSVVHAGDALVIRAGGLRPSRLYSVALYDEEGEIARQSIMSDRRGAVRDAVIWPQIGIDDPRSEKPLSVEKARKLWLGRKIRMALIDLKNKVVAEAGLTVAEKASPLAVATDQKGRLLNGFEIGEHDAVLSLLDFGRQRNIRIWMVPRQHEWRPGDRIRPALLASGRPARVDVAVEGRAQRVVLAKAAELLPGAYDFVLRNVRYGYEDDDHLILRAADVIVSRWSTGLVIREKFWPSKVILGGCTNLQRIACRRTLGGMWPYVQFTDTFQVGEDVWGTLDPNALDPAHTGKAAAIYVVPHKTAAQWTADNSLNHLAVLGGNAATQKWITQSWCTNANLHLLWSNATQVGDYDIVVDFGNNSATLPGFAQDDHYDMPLDLIDGYLVPGFRIVPDPAVDTFFTQVGAFSYDSSTQGSVTVASDYGSSFTVPLNANVRFPADAAGATSPSQISAAQSSYPVVVLVHGNSSHIDSYQGYDYLLDHLARNGFIAASIHLQPGQQGTDRARVLRSHLSILFGMFGTHAANNIGIMGHSRGGEAVVIATRLNQQEAWGWNINAVISLAPTNQYTAEHFGGAWARPYLVIYGSLDGDVGGIGNTGFELYDRASSMKKSMAFVYRACHDRFNTVWGDGDFYFGQLTPADQAAVLSANSHQLIARGYMTAFFRQYLKGETQWEGIFRGEWVPAAVTASDADMRIYTQYEDTTVRTMDDFEGAHSATSWQSSTIGGAVSQSGLPANPQENDLRSMDSQSPHLTAGLLLRWDGTTDSLDYTIPAGQRDVSGYQAVSFRISQKVNSASNPANMVQDLRLTLTDAGGHSRQIRISKLDEIPYPHVRGVASLVKSAMCTIRIPLSAYSIHCYNVDQVDLTNVTTLSFQFSEKATGEIEIDSIQFTN